MHCFAYKKFNAKCICFIKFPPSPPPLRQFQKFHGKLRNAKCQAFLYLKHNANCLAFFEVSGFLYLKTSRNAKCHALCINKCQFQKIHEKLRNVKCLAFLSIKKERKLSFFLQSVLLFVYKYKRFTIFFLFLYIKTCTLYFADGSHSY